MITSLEDGDDGASATQVATVLLPMGSETNLQRANPLGNPSRGPDHLPVHRMLAAALAVAAGLCCTAQMRPRLRHVRALVLAATVAAAGSSAACTAVGSGPPPSQTLPPPAADPCNLPVDQLPGPLSGSRVVLGQVSVPPAYIQEHPVPFRNGMWRYWLKAPIAIRAGHQTVAISVPPAWRRRAAITWGQNIGIVAVLRLPGCALLPRAWHIYAGGFYLVSSAACVPLMFRVGQRRAILRFGVGRHCPGQLAGWLGPCRWAGRSRPPALASQCGQSARAGCCYWRLH